MPEEFEPMPTPTPPIKTALQAAIDAIFGEYVPREYRYTTEELQHFTLTDVHSETDYMGVTTTTTTQRLEAVPVTVEHVALKFDYPWAVGALLFTIVLASLMKMIGGLLKWKV